MQHSLSALAEGGAVQSDDGILTNVVLVIFDPETEQMFEIVRFKAWMDDAILEATLALLSMHSLEQIVEEDPGMAVGAQNLLSERAIALRRVNVK